MAEDASSKKFLVSNFMNYKMVDTRPVMEQFHEMLRILGQYVQHNLMMDKAISVAVIIDKLPPSWKDFKHSLKHKKEELSLCMRTRRSYFSPTSTIPRRSRKQTTNVVEPEFRTIVEMTDNRTMAQMLQAPIEGYEDAIVVPQINANNFELKQTRSTQPSSFL
nr:zinc finger, CCHC-type [Tanacetum cinerariifolium]